VPVQNAWVIVKSPGVWVIVSSLKGLVMQRPCDYFAKGGEQKVAVRVKVNLRFQNKSVTEVALVNSGFETPPPEIVIPRGLALSLWNKALKRAKGESYVRLTGSFKMKRIGFAKVKVITQDRKSKTVDAKLVVSE
jgi:hypothetical protein